MFYNCSSLSSLPDISKWNTNNLIYSFLMFTKCISNINVRYIKMEFTKP